MEDDDFLEIWNKTITFIIHKNDLVRPTDIFLKNALINYIQMLNIDHSKLSLDTRAGSIKLCHYINHIYKLSDDSNSFAWIDLCHPFPKKTKHLLKVILNYMLYYNMIKVDIIEKASQNILAKDTIQTKVNQLEIEIESNKNIAESIDMKIHENEILLTKKEKSIKKLLADKENLTQELNCIDEELKNIVQTNQNLQSEKETLKSQIVERGEADNLLLQHKSIISQIKEQEEIKEARRENNVKLFNSNTELESTIKKLESILENNFTEVFSAASDKEIFIKLKLDIETSSTIKNEIEMKIKELKSLLREKEILFDKENNLGKDKLNQFNNEIEKIQAYLTKQENIVEVKGKEVETQKQNFEILIKKREIMINHSENAINIMLNSNK